MIEAPRITMYARVLDNLTQNEIVRSISVNKNDAWYYGSCNGLEGGESQYLVEFDIWNNERSFNAGTYDYHCLDAENCRLTVWQNSDCRLSNSKLFEKDFMYARCTTLGYDEFNPIRQTYMLKNIVGNSQPSDGCIKGSGDHAIVQTKIVLPSKSDLSSTRYDFVFAFYYDFKG